jgi:hypothetical protein
VVVSDDDPRALHRRFAETPADEPTPLLLSPQSF